MAGYVCKVSGRRRFLWCLYKQNNISAGDAIRAVLKSAYYKMPVESNLGRHYIAI